MLHKVFYEDLVQITQLPESAQVDKLFEILECTFPAFGLYSSYLTSNRPQNVQVSWRGKEIATDSEARAERSRPYTPMIRNGVRRHLLVADTTFSPRSLSQVQYSNATKRKNIHGNLPV